MTGSETSQMSQLACQVSWLNFRLSLTGIPLLFFWKFVTTFPVFTKHSSFEKLSLSNENSLCLKVPFCSRDKDNNIYFGLTLSGIKYWVKTKILFFFFFPQKFTWAMNCESNSQFPFFLVNRILLLQETIKPACLKFANTDSASSHHFLR